MKVTADLTSNRSDTAAQLSLRPLRILSLIHSQDRKAIRGDFNELVSAISRLGNPESGDYSYAAELIALLDPSAREPLLRQLDLTMRFRIRNIPLDPTLTALAKIMMQWYAQNRYTQVCVEFADNLIHRSELENSSEIMRHRRIVADTLTFVVDLDHSKTVTICQRQEPYFERTSGSIAALFYWYYGFALSAVGNAELAKPMLLKCSELYKDCEGEDSWVGTLAMVFYHHFGLESSDFFTSERYLWNFLKKMDEGIFDAYGSWADEIRILTRYVLLHSHLEKKTLHTLFHEVNRFREECERHQYLTACPRLTVRTAENMLCAYYEEIGDYLTAAHHAVQSLETVPPNNLTPVPSDTILYSTLLMLYNALNDAEQIETYLRHLSAAMETSEIDEYYFRNLLLIQTAQVRLNLPMDSALEEYLRDIHTRCALLRDGNTEDLDKWGTHIAYWYVAMIALVNEYKCKDPADLRCCEQLLRYFLNNRAKYPFTQIQLVFAYRELARIELAQKHPEAVNTMKQCLRYSKGSVFSDQIRVTNDRVAAELFYSFKHLPDVSELLFESTERIMNGITAVWHSSVSYLNDHRLSQILASTQFEFDNCYALLRDRTTVESRYTYVLRFKNLAALASRERNAVMQTPAMDDPLKEKIHQLQNQLADAEYDDARSGTERAAALQQQLLHLEAEFSQKFPKTQQYREITGEQVGNALSDGEAIVEYYFAQHPCVAEYLQVPQRDLEIFISTKTDGQSRLHHILMPDGNQILTQACDFIDMLQNPHSAAGSKGRKAQLRDELYQQLLAPVLPHLNGIRTLYIAPDRELFNLPFEILYGETKSLLQDHFHVCRIISGRDVLYFRDRPTFNEGCLLLGDPAYSSHCDASYTEQRESTTGVVCDLPFSGIEVARISKRFDCPYFSGERATKYALKHAGPCRVIHLATHGSFDNEMQTDALYSSSLLFAGYNDWISNHPAREEHGNGILTADEISRLDLRGTELVVMSACLSGMGDISYGTMQGLLSAFSAAGVRWIVCHIWNAQDFATPILMDAFYDAYLNQGYSVPDALQYARHYLSDVTVGQLRQNGWLTPPEDPRISQMDRAYLEDISRSPDSRKLFRDESFWGGFVVYKCQ